jgi:hypothetical protein
MGAWQACPARCADQAICHGLVELVAFQSLVREPRPGIGLDAAGRLGQGFGGERALCAGGEHPRAAVVALGRAGGNPDQAIEGGGTFRDLPVLEQRQTVLVERWDVVRFEVHGALVIRERCLPVAGARGEVPAREQHEQVRGSALECGRQLGAGARQISLVGEHACHSDASGDRVGIDRYGFPVGQKRLGLAAEVVEGIPQPLPRRWAARREPGGLAVFGDRLFAVAGVHQHVPAREMRRGRVGVAGPDER